MPTSAETAPELLLDSSAALAVSVPNHEGRAAVVAAVRGRRLGLAGHAAFETFSVLTRLPQPHRLTPRAADILITTNFPHTRFLSPSAASDLRTALARKGLGGGAVYDALVAATALEQDRPLVTRDRRALRTYQVLDVQVILAE